LTVPSGNCAPSRGAPSVNQRCHARSLLLPLVPLYRLALSLRELRLRTGIEPVRRLRWPVISIGNLSTGGSGKTPLTIVLARALTQRGMVVDVLSRGYGRQTSHAVRVLPAGEATGFGDEPLLIAQQADVPVYVARQRFDAGQLAETSGTAPGLHLLDDGFQHRQLYRDIDILLLAPHDWFEDRLLPAGNLREPLDAARRATIIAIPAAGSATDNSSRFEAALRSWGWQGPIWHLRRRMHIPAAKGPVVAFCGIARPEQFFDGLETAGVRLAECIAFADHHRYTETDLAHLSATAHANKVTTLITTEKDLVRMGSLASRFADPLRLHTAGLTIEIEDQEASLGWLIDQLNTRQA
jgi:tetraacyldisaccharide 4'-kinase